MGWLDALAGLAQAGASAYGAYSAGQAAQQQTSALRDAQQQNLAMQQQAINMGAPWREAGESALATLVPATTGGFETSPGYQFRMDEGTRAIENSAAARGQLDSGATLRALTRFSQGLAGDEYGNWWNRNAALAQLGQTNNSGTLSALTGLTGNLTGLTAGIGQAQAQGAANQYNALASGANGLVGLLAMQGYGGNRPAANRLYEENLAGGGLPKAGLS